MTPITKEQAVQLAREAGFMKFLKPESRPEMICGPDEILRLVKLGRNAGLEEAKQKLLEFQAGWVPDGFTECAAAIESLKDNTP